VTAIGSIGLAGSALGGARRVGSEGPENQPP
jgi:hypothetical protein